MRIRLGVHVCVRTHVCASVCMSACVCVRAHVYAFMCVYMCVRVRACLCSRVCAYVRMCVRVWVHVCPYVCMSACGCVYMCVFMRLYARVYVCVGLCMCVRVYIQALVLQPSTSLGALAPDIRLSGQAPKVQRQQQPRLRHKKKNCKNKFMRQSLLPSTPKELRELNKHLSQHARPTKPRMQEYAEV